MKIREILSEAPAAKKPAPVANPTASTKTTANPGQTAQPASNNPSQAANAQQNTATTNQTQPTSGQPATANQQSPTNPVGKAAFTAGQATAKGVQAVQKAGNAVGQAVATGAEKTANVVAKGAQTTHDAAAGVAKVIDKDVNTIKKIRQGISNVGEFGTTGFMAKDQTSASSRASTGDVETALGDIRPDELKQILLAISSGKEILPAQKTKLANAAYKL